MKIVLKSKKQMEVIEEKEIDIDLPTYREYGGEAVILSPNRIVYLTDGNLMNAGEDMVNLYLRDGDEIPKACFDNAFQKALSKWNALDFEMSTTKATDEDINDKLVEEYGHEAEQFNL